MAANCRAFVTTNGSVDEGNEIACCGDRGLKMSTDRGEDGPKVSGVISLVWFRTDISTAFLW